MGVITQAHTKPGVFENIFDTLHTMIQPEQVVELRILGVDGKKKRVDSGFFNNLDAMAKAAARYDGRGQVYMTPNSVQPDLLAKACNRVREWVEAGDTTNDLQITRRHWFLLDADPERISGISSTEGELQAASERTETLAAYLAGRGWPEPIRARSGNGGHLNYRIDLPNTPESTLLIQRCLLALSMQFTDGIVKIDTSVYNAARIWKLYGTKAIKGDHTDERPHRYAQIISRPDELALVTLDQLQSLAGLAPDPAKKQDNKQSATGAFDLASWLETNGITGKLAPWNGGHRWKLDKCYFSEAHTDGAFIVQLANGAIAAGCSHNTCQGKNWHDLRALFDGTKEERQAKRQAKSEEPEGKATLEADTSASSLPYIVQDKRILCRKFGKNPETGNTEFFFVTVSDFEAKITGENTDEDGNRMFVISGEGVRGGKFSMEIPAADYGDGRKLTAALEAAVGAHDPIYAGQAGHMSAAIKKLTGNDLIKKRTFHRTGWTAGKFLIPGREPDATEIRLAHKLPYAIDPNADLDKGLQALEALMQFMGPETGAIVLSALFQAPMASHAEWRNERYATFIKGRTGTQKTATAQVAMCLYGPDFARDEMMLKFGEGATRNALMAYATAASDLPMLIDNYKPSTGGGARDFTNLIHNILEGGEKERLNRNSQLKETRPIHTWPVCTGEDLPSNDPASLARILVVTFEAKRRGDISHLSKAQSLSKHLCAVGAAWLAWLESAPGQTIVKTASASFETARTRWAAYLVEHHPNMVNPHRVATNLATNELTWIVLTQHPAIGALAERHIKAHKVGLTRIAGEMAGYTSEALEANRFVASLKELIAGGRLIVLGDRSLAIDPTAYGSDQIVGWGAGADAKEKGDGSVYLLPQTVLELVKKYSGDNFGSVTRNALYEQLAQLGFIATHDPQHTTKTVKVGGKAQKLLHLTAAAVAIAEEQGAEEVTENR